MGLLCGLLIATVMRSALGVRIRESAVRSSRVWGPALTGAVVLSAACLASINLLLARVWLTLTIGCAAAVVVLGNPSTVVRLVRRAADAVPRRAVRAAAWMVVPLAVIVFGAVLSAAGEDIVKVRQILDDPAAVHLSPNGESR